MKFVPPAGIDSFLGSPLEKGFWNCDCEGVWPPNAGEAWMEGEVAVDRIEEARE